MQQRLLASGASKKDKSLLLIAQAHRGNKLRKRRKGRGARKKYSHSHHALAARYGDGTKYLFCVILCVLIIVTAVYKFS
ncbi:MAG TPA: hypothetical protein DEB74_03305 [Lachnospiraceae bacterium]|nr:hypothetical protein [Lachnospiraceae bacterium]